MLTPSCNVDPLTPHYYIVKLDIIIKSLDPLRAKKTFIRKKFDHTAVSAIKALSTAVSAIKALSLQG